MPDRIQITKPTYMPVGGQWVIVYPGTVVDVPSARAYSSDNTIKLDEASGTLSNNHITPVRNLRTK